MSVKRLQAEGAGELRNGPTRREFVTMLGAGLMIVMLEGRAVAQAARGGRGRGGRRGGSGAGGAGGAVSGRIHIGKDGAITVLVGKVEGGQGAREELTQAAAEELRVPAERVSLLMGDTSQVPDDGITAGSGTTPRTVPAVRAGAAAARELLVGAALMKWGLKAEQVAVADGKVKELGGKREISYGDLVAVDEKLLAKVAGGNVALTPVKEWKVMGVELARPNGREIVMGAHQYPSDVTHPGMLYGKVLRPPSYGAKLLSIDMDAAKSMKGVVVAREGDFVGVAAGRSFLANEALEALVKSAKWEETEHVSSTDLYAHLTKHARGDRANPFADVVKGAAKSLRATYEVAYVQHAPLEPRATCAVWEDGKVTIWAGTQNPFGVRGEVARALGLAEDAVRIIVPDFGGAFGGKHRDVGAVEAARLAKAAGKPVSLRWTREEEFTWAYFRPAGVMEMEASLDGKGQLTSWHFVNINSGSPGMETPYRCGQARSQTLATDAPLVAGSYRALASTGNHFARESFMDELALLAGSDPLAFRLAHLEEGRLKAVLEAATKRFGWAKQVQKKEPGVGVGLACGTEKGGYVAACAEVEVKAGRIVVRKLVQVFECGAIVNPRNLMMQVVGAMTMGLGPALREAITFEKGAITNAAFSAYPVPRFMDLPELDVELLDRRDLPSAGAGESPIIAVAPAIGNAVFAVTGKRRRAMPLGNV